MNLIFLTTLILCILSINCNIFQNIKRQFESLLNGDQKWNYDIKVNGNDLNAGDKTKSISYTEDGYLEDPVLNYVNRKFSKTRKSLGNVKTRKTFGTETEAESDMTSSSSSMEMQEMKDEFQEHWLKKKFEAMNSTVLKSDVVNMVGARPWGVPCGDPKQHDMPWGTCMLPMECDAEYRIYRGDHFCGRTQFVCCALQVNTYDMYQAFDMSFDDSELSTDTEEKRNLQRGSAERSKRKKRRERQRRRRKRLKRKRKIKKKIRKIVKQIRKLLNRVYRNGTSFKKKKTKQLKKFIKDLKKKYRQERVSVKKVHSIELYHIDSQLQKKLDEVNDLNENFFRNETFRNMIVNGSLTKQTARMLMDAYPQLTPYIIKNERRSGGSRPLNVPLEDHSKDLDRDIEYGLLYL